MGNAEKFGELLSPGGIPVVTTAVQASKAVFADSNLRQNPDDRLR